MSAASAKPLHVCIDSAYTYTVWTNDGDEPIARCKSLETAHLLAAAPDLLRASFGFIGWFKVFIGEKAYNEIRSDELDKLGAAIAKAMSSDVPANEKQKHWFEADRSGFSETPR